MTNEHEFHQEPLRDANVLIVGGSSGMGLELCRQLLQRQARVTIAGRSPQRLQAALEQLAPVGRPAAYCVDATDEEGLRRMLEDIGPMQHVVCTAADIRGSYELLEDLRTEALERAIRSKVIAPILLAKHAARRMLPGGTIAFTSGIAAYRPRPRGVAVAAINAALEGAVRAMAVELAPLRVNAVSPGWVRTPIWQDVAGAQADDMLSSMAQRLPVGRVGTPRDIAQAFLFLMTNGFTTGTVLHVEGGHRLV